MTDRMMNIRVGIVDDHKMVSEGIHQLLDFDGGFFVVYEVHNGKACLEKMQNASCYVDVLILDINMPKLNGLDVLKAIRKKGYPVKIIMLTESSEIESLIEAINLGVEGYILKSVGFSQLVKAIKRVYKGETCIQPELIVKLNDYKIELDVATEIVETLSIREKEVLIEVANGLQNKEIAIKLNISERTVKNHISNIFKKIHVSDRTQAAVFAIKNKLI